MESNLEQRSKRVRFGGLFWSEEMGLPERTTVVLIGGLFLVLYVTQLASFWLSVPSNLVTRFADDAYFYFKIARNIVETGKATFDGTTVTNGFHPLWMGLLLPIFALVKDPLLVLRIVGTLNVTLLAAACFLSFQYLAPRFSVLSFAFSAVLLVRYFLAFVEYSMETSLLILLCVLTLVLAATVDFRSFPSSDRIRIFALGVTTALIQLTRLDAVFFSLALVVTVFCFLLAQRRVRQSMERFALLVVPSVVAGAGYLALNYLRFGHLVPVSGTVKSMGAGLINTRMLQQLIQGLSLAQMTSIWTVFSAMILVSLAFVLVVLVKRGRRLGLAASHHVALIASGFCIVLVIYYLFWSSWRLWGWYSYPGFLVAVFVLPEVVSLFEGRFFKFLGAGAFFRIARITVVAGLLLVTCVATPAIRWGFWRDADLAGNFMYQNYVLAESLNGRFVEPPRMAMGDRAGSFGYFYRGSVLQLEGLVGDYRLLDAIRTDSLMQYMSASGVEYVVSHNGPSQHYGEWTLVIPTPEFSAGPYTDLLLCEDTEIMRRDTAAGTICVWKWPSCRSR